MALTIEQQRALAIASARVRAQEQEEQQVETEQRSTGSELLRQLGLTGRAAYQAFTAPANVVLEAGRGAYNLLAPENRQMPSIAEAESRMLSNIGLPEPSGTLERGVMAGTQAMAGVGGMAKALPNVPALASDLFRQIPAAGTAGLSGQVTAEKTKEYTGSDLAAAVAGIGVSALTAGGVGKAIDAVNKGKVPLYTIDEVKQRAARAYTAMDESGVVIKPSSLGKLFNSIDDSLDEARMVKGTTSAAEVSARIKQAKEIMSKNTPISFTELEKIRGTLNDLRVSSDPDIRRLGSVAVNEVDNYISRLSGTDIIAGKEGVGPAVKSLLSARKDWRNASRANVLEEALSTAEARAIDPRASEGELIRRGFINLAANSKKLKLFSKEEQNIIKSVAKGGSLDPILTFASQFSPLRSKLAAAAGTYGMTQSPVLTGSIAGTGLIADLGQSALRKSAAQAAIKRIASGQTQPGAFNLSRQGTLTGTLLGFPNEEQ